MPALLTGDAWLAFRELPKDKRTLQDIKEALIYEFSIPEEWQVLDTAILTSPLYFPTEAALTRVEPETNAKQLRLCYAGAALEGAAPTGPDRPQWRRLSGIWMTAGSWGRRQTRPLPRP